MGRRPRAGWPLTADLLADRRVATLWWMVGVVASVVLVVVSYGAIKGQAAFDQQMENLPDAVKAMMGLEEGRSITSPGGYLNSQLFANMLPLLLSIFSIGVGARAIAGEEGAGRIELIATSPISRRRLAVERLTAVVVLCAALGLVGLVALVATAPVGDLIGGITVWELGAATVGSILLGLLHGLIAFGVGAGSGRRGVAIGVATGVTAGGFLVQSLAAISTTTRPLRWLSPWYWFLNGDPLDPAPGSSGASAIVVPGLMALGLALLAAAIGVVIFERRDIR